MLYKQVSLNRPSYTAAIWRQKDAVDNGAILSD